MASVVSVLSVLSCFFEALASASVPGMKCQYSVNISYIFELFNRVCR